MASPFTLTRSPALWTLRPVPWACLFSQVALLSPPAPHTSRLVSLSPSLAGRPAPLRLSRHRQWFPRGNEFSLHSVSTTGSPGKNEETHRPHVESPGTSLIPLASHRSRGDTLSGVRHNTAVEELKAWKPHLSHSKALFSFTIPSGKLQ